MRAVVRDEYGGPDVLKIEEIDKPELVDDGVLVRVRAAALNPTDYVLMRGFLRLQTGWRRPGQQAVGIDVAGIVEAVGADVADPAVGDAVFGVCRGAFAEYAVGVAQLGAEARAPELRADGRDRGRGHDGTAGAARSLSTSRRSTDCDHRCDRRRRKLRRPDSQGVWRPRHCRLPCGERRARARQLGADRVVDYTSDDYLR